MIPEPVSRSAPLTSHPLTTRSSTQRNSTWLCKCFCTLNPDNPRPEGVGAPWGSESPGRNWSGDTWKGQETRTGPSKVGESILVSRSASVPGSTDTSCGNSGNLLNLSGLNILICKVRRVGTIMGCSIFPLKSYVGAPVPRTSACNRIWRCDSLKR